MLDFHIHTTYSDGTDDLLTVIDKVKDYNYFSITDHDSIESAKYISKNGLNLPNYVNGVELSTIDLGRSIHILFYNYDVNSKVLNDVIDEIDLNRKDRLLERINILKDNYKIDFKKEDIDYLLSLPNPTKPNIASVIVKYGYAIDVDQAIKDFLYHKLETKKISSEYVIRKLKDEKGILILAHPLGGIGEKRVDSEQLIERLNRFIGYGIKGLECCYSMYNNYEQQFLLNLAKNNNLIISGGSDYHGKNKKVQLGTLSADNNKNYEYINLMDFIKR